MILTDKQARDLVEDLDHLIWFALDGRYRSDVERSHIRKAIRGNYVSLLVSHEEQARRREEAEQKLDHWKRLHDAAWHRLPRSVQNIYGNAYDEARAALAGDTEQGEPA